jgi:hypothetical protein
MTDLGSSKNVAKDLEAPQALQVDNNFPDGGLRAWLVVLGCFLITAIAVGLRLDTFI